MQAIRMVNQAMLGALAAHSAPQGLRRESLGHAFAHRVPGAVTAVLPRFAALTQVAKVPVGMAIRL